MQVETVWDDLLETQQTQAPFSANEVVGLILESVEPLNEAKHFDENCMLIAFQKEREIARSEQSIEVNWTVRHSCFSSGKLILNAKERRSLKKNAKCEPKSILSAKDLRTFQGENLCHANFAASRRSSLSKNAWWQKL